MGWGVGGMVHGVGVGGMGHGVGSRRYGAWGGE